MTHFVRAIFFDAVGTLIHPAEPPARTYAAAAARHGVVLEEFEISRQMGAAFRVEEDRDRAVGWVTSEGREVERWRNIVSACLGNDRCFPELWDHYAKPEAWTVDPDAAETIKELRDRGLTLGLASNLDRRLLSVVEGLGVLAQLKPRIVVSSQVGYRKPSGSFFAELMATLSNVTSDQVVYVGDDLENDYRGAGAMAMRSVLLDPSGRHPAIANRIAKISELLTREFL